MAKTELSHEQQEIIRAQNDALLRLPAGVEERTGEYLDLRRKHARQNDLIAQAKKEAGATDALRELVEKRGLKPQAIKMLNVFAEMEAAARAAACRQVISYFQDLNWIYPDLFDKGAIGVGSNDVAGETAGFDATSEAKRRGGDTAQPRTVEQMAESHPAAQTPGVPLDEALQQLEAYRAANPPKRGAKPKELKALEAQVEAARAAHNESEAGPAELPEAKPGEITEGLRETSAASEAHIREQSAGPAAPPPEPEAAPKPKRASRKKAEAAAAPAAPPAEEEEDDTIDVEAPVGRPDAIGTQPATFRVG